MKPSYQPELFDEDSLARRLRSLGLHEIRGIESHENRSVTVSVTSGGILRVHRGFAYAPDTVLSAIVTFVTPGVRGEEAVRAKRLILGFPIDRVVPRRRPRGPRRRSLPEDGRLVRELALRHKQLNEFHFEGSLSYIRFRISPRMRTKLGELTLDANDRPLEIAISRRHIARDGWAEVEHTLLHEMIHQWQAETGRQVDHGGLFREKARELGIAPAAQRDIVGLR